MTRVWTLVVLLGAATMLLKATGPLLAGGRTIPAALRPTLVRLAPALFGALLATQTFARGGSLTLDARAGGLAAAVLAAWLRLPPLAVLAFAIATTAALRHLLQQ